MICDICLNLEAVRHYNNLGYCEDCWQKCERDRKCKICGSKEDLIASPNLLRVYICEKCWEQEQTRFAKDLEMVLYGREEGKCK